MDFSLRRSDPDIEKFVLSEKPWPYGQGFFNCLSKKHKKPSRFFRTFAQLFANNK